VKVLVTGGGGFVGRWLSEELEAAGHTVTAPVGRDTLDITDRGRTGAIVAEVAPDAIAHLAAISFGPDARDDPALALRTNVGGTLNVLEAARAGDASPAILVTSSSEVYGAPEPGQLPLDERSSLRASSAYALSKCAQEGVALAHAARTGTRVVVTRAFNHTGPGQRDVFVVPALARRVATALGDRAAAIRVGNLDVRRDFTDVRDVVRAYRLLLESLAAGSLDSGGVFNICSGESHAIREILETFLRAASIDAEVTVDPALVRPEDPVEIRGDASALERATGWTPRIPFATTLADVWQEAAA
jgi:GDP-4-dehydro-6-deoxy-D-mannose reductase